MLAPALKETGDGKEIKDNGNSHVFYGRQII